MIVGIINCYEFGYNYLLTDFQAALSIIQLEIVDESLVCTKEITKNYSKLFKNGKCILNQLGVYEKYAYNFYIIDVEKS